MLLMIFDPNTARKCWFVSFSATGNSRSIASTNYDSIANWSSSAVLDIIQRMRYYAVDVPPFLTGMNLEQSEIHHDI